MTTLVPAFRRHLAALRLLLLMTVVTGILYPLFITGIAQIPGLKHRADGSLVSAGGHVVGSSLIGQNFTDAKGNPLLQYFQSRPSAAGESGYDPTASSASNLGPENILDTPSKPSLLSEVCTRSLAIGALDHVDGSRPFCTPDGVGAVLAVFWSGPGYAGHVEKVLSADQFCPSKPFLASYKGVSVACTPKTADLSTAQVVPVRGSAPAHPAVPADAVTSSGSGLDPDISPAYAKIQIATVAAARHLPVSTVAALVAKNTDGRELGFLGEATVNVLALNRDLDDGH